MYSPYYKSSTEKRNKLFVPHYSLAFYSDNPLSSILIRPHLRGHLTVTTPLLGHYRTAPIQCFYNSTTAQTINIPTYRKVYLSAQRYLHRKINIVGSGAQQTLTRINYLPFTPYTTRCNQQTRSLETAPYRLISFRVCSRVFRNLLFRNISSSEIKSSSIP